MHVCHSLCVKVRNQLIGIVSLLPPCMPRVKPRSSALMARMFTCGVISSVLFLSHFFYEKLDYVSKAEANSKWKKRRSGRLPNGDGDDEENCGLIGQIPILLLGKRQKKIGPHLCNYNRFPFHAGRKVHHLWFSITSAFCLHHFYSLK